MAQPMAAKDVLSRPVEQVAARPTCRLRVRALALAIGLAVVCWDTLAYGVNALVSQDLPILTEIAATETASYLELLGILEQARESVALAKEYTGLAKAAYRAVEEVRELSWADVRGGVVKGLDNAFPEVASIYGDIRDIKDLRKVRSESVATLQGILWAKAYGPGIEYLHEQHAHMEALARALDQRARHAGIIGATRAQLEGLAADCTKGEGACMAAGNRAQIKTAQLLTDVHETALKSLELQAEELKERDQAALGRFYAFERFLGDVDEHVQASLGLAPTERKCRAGRCLLEEYRHARSEVIARFRGHHPPRSH